MTINERIRTFRKDVLKINQRSFSERLGTSQTGLSYLEQAGNPVQESTIKSICATFGLNENWLRNGTGEMYQKGKNPDELFEDYLAERGMDPLSIEVVMAFIELDSNQRKIFLEALKKIHELTVQIEGEKTPEELEKERNSPEGKAWAAEFKKQRIERKKREKQEFLERLREEEAATNGGDAPAGE